MTIPLTGTAQAVNLMFIHHSVGGQLLADHGPATSGSHPNGGGLRARLAAAGFVVNTATYGSELGQNTDLFDWLPKFRTRMADILAGRNQVVLFKSCYPNSAFLADVPGDADPAGPVLTPASARATFTALREEFARQPQVLFVYLTAPPLPLRASPPAWKRLARRLLGRASLDQHAAARRAREFNDWLQAADGWLAGYAGHNIAVFDYFDVLTAGRSDFLAFATDGGRDAHPSAEGQGLAAERLAPFVQQAWMRTQRASAT
jgi:hypothetical protein